MKQTRPSIILFVLVLLACDPSRKASIDGGAPFSSGGTSASSGGAPSSSGGALSSRGGAPSSSGGAPSSSGVPTPTFKLAAEKVVNGCAKLLGCVNGLQASYRMGLGECVADLTRLGAEDLGRETWNLSMNDDNDALLEYALMESIDCVLGASECTAVLACLNQGKAQPSCTDPRGYTLHRRCMDSGHLRGCSFGVEASFDCGKLGLTCIETKVPDFGTLATCAVPDPSGQDPVTSFEVRVACQGNYASLSLGKAKYVFGCDVMDGICVPGTYDFTEEVPKYCRAKNDIACNPSTSNWRCDGDKLIRCRADREVALDCASIGTRCVTDRDDDSSCTFPCADSSETCDNGVVGYCGPSGLARFDCSTVGYSSCETNTIGAPTTPARAWCTP